MKQTITRRKLMGAMGVAVTTVSLSGCLGDDDGDEGGNYSVPDASFTVIEDKTNEEPPQIRVAHSGEAINEENSSSIEVRSDPGGDQQFSSLGAFDPITEGPIDGAEKEFAGSESDFESGREIQFVWISPDAEREATLDTWDVP